MKAYMQFDYWKNTPVEQQAKDAQEMGKCGAGKCGAGRCGVGKCGAQSVDKTVDEPLKEETMKCGAGKCGAGKCGG